MTGLLTIIGFVLILILVVLFRIENKIDNLPQITEKEKK